MQRTEPKAVKEGEKHTFSEGDAFTYRGVLFRVLRARNGKLRIVAEPAKCLTGSPKSAMSGGCKPEPASAGQCPAVTESPTLEP